MKDMPSQSGSAGEENAGGSGSPIAPGNFNFAGDEGGFKPTETWDAITGHFDGAVGATEDPTTTKKTVMQTVQGGVLKETSVSLPSYNGEGLSNEDYHKAAGGGSIPMTYG